MKALIIRTKAKGVSTEKFLIQNSYVTKLNRHIKGMEYFGENTLRNDFIALVGIISYR